MSNSLSIIPATVTPRRRYPVQYKCQVVQESLAPGASIAGVALAHGLNANLLHNWRWQYRRGDFGPMSCAPTFLPVQVKAGPAALATNPATPAKTMGGQTQASSGAIEVMFGAARVVIHGMPDQATLRCVIDALRT